MVYMYAWCREDNAQYLLVYALLMVQALLN